MVAHPRSHLTGTSLPVEVPIRFLASGDLVADLTVVYCEKTAPELCLIEIVRFIVPIRLGGRNAAREVVLSHEVSFDPAAG